MIFKPNRESDEKGWKWKNIFLDFLTQMKLWSWCPSFVWKIEVSIGCAKKRRTHRIISCPKKTVDISYFKFQNGLKPKTFFFLNTNGNVGAKPPNKLQILLQILTPAPELVGDQSDMLVWQFFHTFFLLMWHTVSRAHSEILRGLKC